MIDFKKQHRRTNSTAVYLLIDWAGTKAELARIAGVHRSTVNHWCSVGKVSRDAAEAISKFPGCPLTREQIRSDIKVWG